MVKLATIWFEEIEATIRSLVGRETTKSSAELVTINSTATVGMTTLTVDPVRTKRWEKPAMTQSVADRESTN